MTPRSIYWFTMMLIFSCSTSQEHKVTPQAPERNRFVFQDLVAHLNEPMELDFLPDGRILFIERRGILKMYEPETKITRVVGKVEVNYINENGLLGMALDPNFEQTPWIYLFYTDPVRKSYQHVSRFVFRNDSLINQSEKLLLDFYIDYENCCHFGGCLAFGPDGNLFISSGDNVGGKDYAPIDERPGRYLHDSQRSSSNTNDLRGSILRIKPEPDGTYSIPDGNLFPPGTPLTRPEIYVMGVRNALKITVDQETGWLYWGDVGPNPGWKYPDWGPASHEEINQAKHAGNFGWPYFLADNQAFRDLDFATNEPGEYFDPDSVVNDSPNNTGIKPIPPAQKSLIWYPNTPSDTFPLVGTGGGTACAGPVYHYDEHLEEHGNWPRYYDDKLIIYEWMRSWVLAVTLDENGQYESMESLFEQNPFKKPIDIEFGPDGAMYLLDYGSNWYAHNPDAKLTRISYHYGNRAPVAEIKASKIEGTGPLEIQFSAAGSSDPDADTLQYQWLFTGSEVQSTEISPQFTFVSNKNYEVKLRVSDGAGLISEDTQVIRVGNEPPEVRLDISDNQSFFIPGQPINYNVIVTDLEDGSTENGGIEEGVQVILRTLKNTTYVNDLRDHGSLNTAILPFLNGKKLLDNSDCLACHAMEKKSIGPSLKRISEHYQSNDQEALTLLSTKILSGGTGVWGDQLMPAHPQHTQAEAEDMVGYILALTKVPDMGVELPMRGTINTAGVGNHDLLMLTAAYKDRGANGQPPLEKKISRIFRPVIIPATEYDFSYRISHKPYNEQGDLYSEVALNGCYIGFEDVDLTGIPSVRIRMRSNADFIEVEARQGGADGVLIGKQRKDLEPKEDKWASYLESDWFYLEVELNPVRVSDDLYFVFNSDKQESDYIYFDICQLHSLEFVMENEVL